MGGKIGYANGQLELEMQKMRRPVEVDEHQYRQGAIPEWFLNLQDPHLRKHEPQTHLPRVVFCENDKGILKEFPISQITYICRGKPGSGGVGIAYKVLFGQDDWRVLWHGHDGEWFFDVEQYRGKAELYASYDPC